jgi:tetratricopeptide (TPR) repeat protein
MKFELTTEDRGILKDLRLELRRWFRRAGRGSRKHVLEQLGASESMLDSAFQRGSVKVVLLLKLVRELGGTPREFFSAALGPDSLVWCKPEGKQPVAVKCGFQRLDKEGWPSQVIGVGEAASWFERLERERLDQPREIVRSIENAAKTVDLGHLPRLYGIYGPALRQLSRLPEARWAYYLGMSVARRVDDISALGDLTQKSAWVEAAEGGLATARKCLEIATSLYSEIGDVNSIGKTLVDRGIIYFLDKKHLASNRCLESALSFLSESEFENRASAHQHLAMNCHAMNSKKLALYHLEQAQALAAYCSKLTFVRLMWFEARHKFEILNLDAAADAFEKISDYFLKSENYREAALATAELGRCRLAQGKLREAESLCETFRFLSFHLKGTPAAEARRIHVAGRSCALKDSMLVDAINVLKDDKARAQALALATAVG